MKRKLLAVLTLLIVCVASIASAAIVYADAFIVPDNYGVTEGVTVDSHQQGGVAAFSTIKHADILEMKLGGTTLNATDHKYMHIKGKVSENVYRIKFNYRYNAEGSSTSTLYSSLFNTTASGGIVTLGEDRTFELHIETPDALLNNELNRLSFTIYINGKSSNERVEKIEFWGVAFTASESYTDFVQPEPAKPVAELKFGAMQVTGTNATVENNKATFVAADESTIDNLEGEDITYLSIPVENYNASDKPYVSFKYKASGITEIGMHAVGTDENGDVTGYVAQISPAGWNVTLVDYAKEGYSVATANIGSYLSTYTATSALIFKFKNQANATFEIVEITATKDGEHGFEVPLGEMVIGDITVPSRLSATYSKDANGAQTITYTELNGWSTFDISVTNYDKNNYIFEAVMTANAAVEICFDIGGTVNWSLGHKAYPADRTSTEQIDVSSYNLPANFTIRIYIDAKLEEISAARSVTFKSITFKTPDPEPTGMYIAKPTTSSMNCLESSLGWDLTWTHGEWSSVKFEVKNYETDYDMLVINISGIKGMNLGVRIVWLEENEGEVIECHDDIRNHWAEEGLIAETGDMELVFFMEAFGLKGKTISGFHLYFDPPTNTYTPNEGEQSTTLYSVEFLKSSEQEFETLNITAEEMTVDFTGEAINFVAENDQDLDLEIKYCLDEATDKWSTSAPSKAGVYPVKVTFKGSLAFNYQVVTSKLTINKIQATVSQEDVTINPEDNTVTVAEGVLASTNEEFVEGFEVVTGDTIAYGTVIYFKRLADENHTESTVLSMTYNRPVTPEPPVSAPDSSVAGEPSNSSSNGKSCVSSVVGLGMETLIALALAVTVFASKKRS